jgi:N utilization substance protein A
MTEIKLDANTLRLYALFERVTGATVRDIVEEEDRTVFVVEEGQIGRALGKGAQNLKRLRDVLQKDVEMIGYADDRVKFIQNLFHRFELKEVEFLPRPSEGDAVVIRVDPAEKGKAIGKGGRNVQLARKLAQRHHKLSDVSVE